MSNNNIMLKQEKEPDACEKLSIICPFVERNGKQDCQGCIFKVHTIAELQSIVLNHYLGS